MWNKQDYQTKGKKWRDRSEWIITENAHPSIITEELFNKCQENARKRDSGGGEYLRKERVEEIVTNKLRTTLLRLSMDNQLADEIQHYYNEKNKSQVQRAATMGSRG